MLKKTLATVVADSVKVYYFEFVQGLKNDMPSAWYSPVW